jgi:hypothetical protein
MTLTAWTVLLALGVVLAAAGYEYDRRPIFAEPTHWTNAAAYAVKVIGRMLTLLAVLLFCAGPSVVEGGLHF